MIKTEVIAFATASVVLGTLAGGMVGVGLGLGLIATAGCAVAGVGFVGYTLDTFLHFARR
jgi:uncharacterized protein YcfJ